MMAAKILSISTQLAVGSDYRFVTGMSRFTRLGRSIRRTYPEIESASRASEVSHSRHAVVHTSLMARDDSLTVVAATDEMFTRLEPVRGLERCSAVLIQTECCVFCGEVGWSSK